MKTCSLMPSRGCKLGTIWMELEPFPTTPTLLFRKSYLGDNVSAYSVTAGHNELRENPLVVPLPRMEQLSLERLQPRDVRPRRLVEQAPRRDEDVAVLLEDLARVSALDPNRPLPAVGVPHRPQQLVLRLDEPRCPITLRHALEIPLDLSAGGIEGGPMRVWGEGVLI